MKASVQLTLPPVEVKKPHHDDPARIEVVKKLHQVPIAMAKARIGAAVERAIGDAPRKAFGHEGLVSAVCSGEKAPEYLARIYANTEARRRFALALLEDDADVVITTTITIAQKQSA